MKKLQEDYAQGLIELDSVKASMASFKGHLKHGNTYRLKAKLYQNFTLCLKNKNH